MKRAEDCQRLLLLLLFKITEDCQILSNIRYGKAEDFQILSKLTDYCKILSKYYEIWEGRGLSSVMQDYPRSDMKRPEDCQILSKITEDCQMLFKIRYGKAEDSAVIQDRI